MKATYNVWENPLCRGEWVCEFLVGGHHDCDERGTYGTGVKLYPTQQKAIEAGKRYLKKMQKNGFDI